ncbi:LysR family transcriptional regulator [Actinokineospora sp. UTMC 2448]|uniref:LysR family transcriptional regulator n=1 Tax=Actinokineospora sp. UTMC 2448 TaxID=2268449 RepID=UPI002164CD39|nr:LysR family transcriptional regulator [Actinokineospora sp. UTMC 2448]UVS77355.1 HTH-type transcriptional regulator GltC [Actinokineospora sp. UTMC 2448]
MDLIGAYRAFAHVAERGSFTLGAAAAGIPQSVASRRVAALEEHLGGRLFDRSTRRAALTPFGRDLLPSAKRLVRLAESVEHEARRAKRRPVRMAVPDTCATLDLAWLDADARAHDVVIDFHRAPPAERADLVRAREVPMALLAVPPDEGDWTVPLGVAGVAPARPGAVHLESLRMDRTTTTRRRVLIQPEDDVPHVRDRLQQVRDAVGLRPSQVAVADSLVAAVAEVLGSTDLLLCSRAQAREFGLHWRPLGELRLARGYDLVDPTGTVHTHLSDAIARCLGAEGAQ